jgi:hypothetical protein
MAVLRKLEGKHDIKAGTHREDDNGVALNHFSNDEQPLRRTSSESSVLACKLRVRCRQPNRLEMEPCRRWRTHAEAAPEIRNVYRGPFGVPSLPASSPEQH